MQHIPGWWIGAYWMNPVTWSLYGLVVTNLEDEFYNIVQLTDGGTITEFLRNRFGYRHEWEGWVVIVLAAFAVFFWGVGALQEAQLSAALGSAKMQGRSVPVFMHISKAQIEVGSKWLWACFNQLVFNMHVAGVRLFCQENCALALCILCRQTVLDATIRPISLMMSLRGRT